MKKYVYLIIFAIVFLSVSLCGCNDKNYFIGKWKSSEYGDVYNFYSNGTMSHVVYNEEYDIDENRIFTLEFRLPRYNQGKRA